MKFYDCIGTVSRDSGDEPTKEWKKSCHLGKCKFKVTNHRYVLLDRDGTINVDRGYVADPEQIELLPNATQGLFEFQQTGFRLIVVTNQSGIARGYFDQTRLAAIHDRLRHCLSSAGVRLDAIYVCPHCPDDGCECRKPRAGLVLQAVVDCHFRPEESIFIGDKPCDILLGQAIGATTILVRTGYGRATEQSGLVYPDFIADDLLDAAHFIQRSCMTTDRFAR